MDTLDAVNEILEAVGEPPASALDTGGSTDVALAEVFLDRFNLRIQSEGWTFNSGEDYEIVVGAVKVTVGAITGTYTPLETVTQSGSGATGTIMHAQAGSIYVYVLTGTFVGSGTMTGGTSGATSTASAVATITESPVSVPATWIVAHPHRVDGALAGSIDFSSRQGRLHNPDVEHDPATFDSGDTLRVDFVELVDFESVPEEIAAYVVAAAAVKFQRHIKGGSEDDSFLREELALARTKARQFESDANRRSLFDTEAHRRMTGRNWHNG